MFLGCARRSLAPAAAAGRLSLGDVHSLLQLLCPDFPVVPVKNAWSPAVAIQTCKGCYSLYLHELLSKGVAKRLSQEIVVIK